MSTARSTSSAPRRLARTVAATFGVAAAVVGGSSCHEPPSTGERPAATLPTGIRATLATISPPPDGRTGILLDLVDPQDPLDLPRIEDQLLRTCLSARTWPLPAPPGPDVLALEDQWSPATRAVWGFGISAAISSNDPYLNSPGATAMAAPKRNSDFADCTTSTEKMVAAAKQAVMNRLSASETNQFNQIVTSETNAGKDAMHRWSICMQTSGSFVDRQAMFDDIDKEVSDAEADTVRREAIYEHEVHVALADLNCSNLTTRPTQRDELIALQAQLAARGIDVDTDPWVDLRSG